jgi:hypothetical protein
MQPSREARVRGLIRAGELLVSGEDQAAVPSYFSPDFGFHGPGGVEADREGLQDYFALPDGNVILPTGKPFDLEFAQAASGTATSSSSSPLSGTPRCRRSSSACRSNTGHRPVRGAPRTRTGGA